MVEMITKVNSFVNGLVWGIPAMVLILGAGILLSVMCGFPQFAKFGYIMKNTFGKAFEKTEAQKGSVSPIKAMFTALAASIGTGNIAGVSGAIALGGPGAVFWMWVSALLGMCTKFSEVVLAVKYRERNDAGDWVGGPMYYIRNGLGKSWAWLGSVSAVLGCLAAYGIGNMTQVNTIAGTINTAISGIVPTTPEQQKVIALVIGRLPGMTRMMRSQVLSLKEKEFVESAKAMGSPDMRTVFLHILPHTSHYLFIRFTTGISSCMLGLAGLAFLGVGLDPSIPNWGSIISDGQQLLFIYPYMIVYPGIALCICVLGFNLLGEGLRDVLDPRYK